MRKRKPKGQVKTECSKCGNPLEEHRVGKNRYCTSCHNEHMRENRPKHSDLEPEAKKKANARSYLNVYIRRGKIKKQPCQICGNEKAEAHHHDYDKPLDVEWFCRKCHLELHKSEKVD